MADSSDSCVPQTLTDFVFDLYDSVTLSQLPEEQSRLYNVVLKDLSSKYFATSPWPTPQSIASECNGDPLFLAFYRELTHRHWHAVSRPTLRDRMEGWDVYRELLDELLETAESDLQSLSSSSANPKLFINPDWVFDILNEFVYQFQGFCQFRTTLYGSAKKHNLLGPGSTEESTSGKAPPHHVVENVSILQQAGDVWNVETVYTYLNRLVQIGTSPALKSAPAYQYFGIFASVSLSRLECLLGDYTGCLQAMAPLYAEQEGGGPMVVQLPKPQLPIAADDEATLALYEPKSFEQVAHSVLAARISLTYHAGIASLMLRRYKDAIATVGELCSFMQRGFKTGELRKRPNSDQFFKNYERMIALLALLVNLCPTTVMDESVAKTLREKHGSNNSVGGGSSVKIGELFGACSPKFILPHQPDFNAPAPASVAGASPFENPVVQQIKLLEASLDGLEAQQELRSYLKLYTSIPVSKLATFGSDPLTLMSLKLATRQLEFTRNSSDDNNDAVGGAELFKSALDIHYYLSDDDIVHIDEPEKQRRFENFFLAQTVQSYDIRLKANAIDVNI